MYLFVCVRDIAYYIYAMYIRVYNNVCMLIFMISSNWRAEICLTDSLSVSLFKYLNLNIFLLFVWTVYTPHLQGIHTYWKPGVMWLPTPLHLKFISHVSLGLAKRHLRKWATFCPVGRQMSWLCPPFYQPNWPGNSTHTACRHMDTRTHINTHTQTHSAWCMYSMQ